MARGLTAKAALGLQRPHRILAAFNRMPVMSYSRTARLILLALATLLLLGGCGQKGPLYLPDEQQEEE
jgi:hypothetical protein